IASARVLTDSLKHVVFKSAGREVRDGFSSQLFPGFGNVLIPSAKLPCGLSLCGTEHLIEGRICAVVVLKPAQGCPLPGCFDRRQVTKDLDKLLAPNVGERCAAVFLRLGSDNHVVCNRQIAPGAASVESRIL